MYHQTHTICISFLSIIYWVLAALEWQVVQKEYRVQHLTQLITTAQGSAQKSKLMVKRVSWDGPEEGLQKQCSATFVLGQAASLVKKNLLTEKKKCGEEKP